MNKMKIRFNRHELAAAIAPLMSCVSTKVTVPAAEGILIEAREGNECVLTTFDLEKGMRITTHMDVIEGGSYIINALKLSQTLRVMPEDEMELEVDDRNVATIICGRSRHKMNALPGSDFPAIPKLVSNDAFFVNRSDLREMLSQTMYAMGVNDQRIILNGTYVQMENNTLTMVSCDNFKLAKCVRRIDYTTEQEQVGTFRNSFILPVKTVNELVKLLGDTRDRASRASDDEDESTSYTAGVGTGSKVRIFMTLKNIVFGIGELTFFSRLIEGEYIDYNSIIRRDHKYRVELDRDELISALERAALVTEEKIAGSLRSNVKLTFDGSLLKITATSAAGATYDEIEIGDIGTPLTIGFNNRYLMNSVRACTSERICVEFTSHLSQFLITPAEPKPDTSEVFMLLPVRLKD